MACSTCMGDASGDSSGGEWVGATHGGGGTTSGSPGVGRRGCNAILMGNRGEGSGKGDESRGHDGRVGSAWDGEGIGMGGDWLSGGENRGDDVTGTNDGGEGDGESEKSRGCDNGQTGDTGERESIGRGMASDCERGCNVAWTVDGGEGNGKGKGKGERDLSDGSDDGDNVSQAWEPSNRGLGTSSPGSLKH